MQVRQYPLCQTLAACVSRQVSVAGSVSSLLQQAGRAGRREQPSASIYVAFDGPTDQYFFRHPEQLFGRPVEKAQVPPAHVVTVLACQGVFGKSACAMPVQAAAGQAAMCGSRGLLRAPLPHAAYPGQVMSPLCARQIDAQNEQLMGQHLACAALELPLLLDADQAYFGPRLPAVAAELRKSGPRALSCSPGFSLGCWGLAACHGVQVCVPCIWICPSHGHVRCAAP